MPSLNPASNFDESLTFAAMMAAAYTSAIGLLGENGFNDASADLRELIEHIAVGRNVSLLAAAGLVVHDLHMAGRLNSSTRMMIRATVFSLFLDKTSRGETAGPELPIGDPSLN